MAGKAHSRALVLFRKDLPRGLHTFATSDCPSRRGIPGCPSPAPPTPPGPRAAAPPARATRLALRNHRIRSVGKDLRDHRVQPAAERQRVNQTVPLSATPTLSLNPSRDGDPTASPGSAFRCLSTLSVQTFLLLSSLKGLPAWEHPAHVAATAPQPPHAPVPLTPPPAFRASQWQGWK